MTRSAAKQLSRDYLRADHNQKLDLGLARIAARAWAETVGEEWRVNQASLFAHAAIAAYAAVVCPR
jgi:hypothetical protein